jgi:hypothetical protein
MFAPVGAEPFLDVNTLVGYPGITQNDRIRHNFLHSYGSYQVVVQAIQVLMKTSSTAVLTSLL